MSTTDISSISDSTFDISSDQNEDHDSPNFRMSYESQDSRDTVSASSSSGSGTSSSDKPTTHITYTPAIVGYNRISSRRMLTRRSRHSHYVASIKSSNRSIRWLATYKLGHDTSDKESISSNSRNDFLRELRNTPLACDPMKNIKPPQLKMSQISERSLVPMGYKPTKNDEWENIPQAQKSNLWMLLRKMIIGHVEPDLRVFVGEMTFFCHWTVLRCYSAFFRRVETVHAIRLPSDRITPQAFETLYDWAVSDGLQLQREGIVELMMAAVYLEVDTLVYHCWSCLADEEVLKEEAAFLLYVEARKFDLIFMEQIMLSRISMFFLSMVACKEFLDLTVKNVVDMFERSILAVNSEIEVFYSAVRWLNAEWPSREKYIAKVMKKVRFGLLPGPFLLMITESTSELCVERVRRQSVVKKLIDDGLFYSTALLKGNCYSKEFKAEMLKRRMKIPLPRRWVFDRKQKHHHNRDCPGLITMKYNDFLKYLTYIQQYGPNYWRTLQVMNSDWVCNCLKR